MHFSSSSPDRKSPIFAPVRCIVEIIGVVQGVGFRPTLARLARASGLGGEVRNCAGRVQLTLEGDHEHIERFLQELPGRLPAPAVLSSLRIVERAPLRGLPRATFEIAESVDADAPRVLIPPDLAVCPDCAREVFDPSNRRYGYAFTTCAVCGPRYTVTRDLPYDRARTSLSAFPLCRDCAREYHDPANRRYHAESIACPACGPRLRYTDAAGCEIGGDPLRAARADLAAGRIIAVRGIGGFLLAADARNRPAIERLRARKRRPHKPIAVMAASADVIRRECRPLEEAVALLSSAAAPILILDIPSDFDANLPLDLLSPDTRTLGVMLPASPLHLLLAHPLPGDPTPAFDWLVMTSGNRAGEPIASRNEEALDRLGGIADGFLLHNREILLRNDDSVCAWAMDAPRVWRRARGWAPRPVSLAHPLKRRALAFGAQQRNTVAVGIGSEIILSPHIGDLDTPEAVDALDVAVERLLRFLRIEPEMVAVDLHPDYTSTQAGRSWATARGCPVISVQHHHAHAVACLAEYGAVEALALVFDGTGYGPDGRIWGAELLRVGPDGFDRLGTFAPAPLPGGDAAIRDPRRQLAGRWIAAGIKPDAEALRRWGLSETQWATWGRQIEAGLQCPWSHAAGRVFDAMAVALDITGGLTTYDGRPAIRLEALARASCGAATNIPFDTREERGLFIVDWTPAFAQLAQSPAGDPSAFAFGFHEAIARAALRMAEYGSARTGLCRIALSGGCFMNRLLCEKLTMMLRDQGFEPLLHRDIPSNDGGIALGQAAVAGYLSGKHFLPSELPTHSL